MIRKEAMRLILAKINSEPIVSANGFISRDLFELKDKPSNFYMIGSMGLASSIGLGVALKNPTKKNFVFDGDGSILMNLGSLTTIAALKPKNFIHIILEIFSFLQSRIIFFDDFILLYSKLPHPIAAGTLNSAHLIAI